MVANPPPAPPARPASAEDEASPADESDTPAGDDATNDEAEGTLELVDPDPSRPLPKAPYFIEVRGDDVDIVAVTGCGSSTAPSAVFSTYVREQLILCADGPPDTGPNLTLGSPSARRAGRFRSGHSQFDFNGAYYETRSQLTVVISKFGAVGKIVEGRYITEVRSLDDKQTRTFFGRFRVLREPDSRSVQF